MASFYGYDSDGGESWDDTPVNFLRPDGDTEGKDVQWCLDNEFFEVEEGFWSGDWYYENHPEEKRFHDQRLKRTREIRQRAEQRRTRVRAQRNQMENDDGMSQADAAFLAMLMGDIARQQRQRVPTEEMLFEGLSSPFGAPPFNQSYPDYEYPGAGYDAGYSYDHQTRNQHRGAVTSNRKKSKKNNRPHATGSKEWIEQRNQKMLENVIRWAEGDQGIVDRTRAALKETNKRPFKCPCDGCKSRFPTAEMAELHGKNAHGKAHMRYRKESGLPEPSKGIIDRNAVTNVRCPACGLESASQELADFHLKNEPRHSGYRLKNDMTQEWDQNLPERFACPVCGLQFLSPGKMEEHVKSQPGKAHDRYRRAMNHED